MLRLLQVLIGTTILIVCANAYEDAHKPYDPSFFQQKSLELHHIAPPPEIHYLPVHQDHKLEHLESKVLTLIHLVQGLKEEVAKLAKGQETITNQVGSLKTIIETGFAESNTRFSNIDEQLANISTNVRTRMDPPPCPPAVDYTSELANNLMEVLNLQQTLQSVSNNIQTIQNTFITERDSQSNCNEVNQMALISKLDGLEIQNENILRVTNGINCTQPPPPKLECAPSKFVSPASQLIIALIHDYKYEWCRNEQISQFCDENGNLIVQLHTNNKENFNRTWSDYKWGFGSVKEGNFWLGNEALFQLTAKSQFILRFDFEDFNNQTNYAEYDVFQVGGEYHGYVLKIGGFSGTAGDSMTQTHNGNSFSTYDYQDHNLCPNLYGAGWWFGTIHTCHTALPNGVYDETGKKNDYQGIIWNTWRGSQTLAKSKMSLKIKQVVHQTVVYQQSGVQQHQGY